MPVTSLTRDAEALTLTVVADFGVSRQRLWDAYVDARQIEKFWGPPTYPSTFTRHDAFVGGRSHYYMTGPEGEQHGGYWAWEVVEEPSRFVVTDGFADLEGNPAEEMPAMRAEFDFEETDAGARLTVTSTFASAEQLEQVVAMGMEEGVRESMSQIDAVLADLASFALGAGTQTQILSDTQVRITRIIRGSVADVWRAHHDPDLMKRWLLGPDGWTMPVCIVAENVGDTYTQQWASEDGEQSFGFTGTLLESASPHREVTTEQMIGTEGPQTRNELTLTPAQGGTLLSLVVTYPDAATRDMILGTGMADGMETSYARLEREVLGSS